MNRLMRNLAMVALAALVLIIPSFASAASAKKSQDPGQLVRQIMGLAYENQQSLNSVPFGIGDSLNDVENSWGPSEDKGTVASNYFSRHIRFIYDNSTPAEKITSIEDEDPRLAGVSLSHVKKQMGQPYKVVEQEGNYYAIYRFDNGYEVEFVFESIYADRDPEAFMYIVRPIK